MEVKKDSSEKKKKKNVTCCASQHDWSHVAGHQAVPGLLSHGTPIKGPISPLAAIYYRLINEHELSTAWLTCFEAWIACESGVFWCTLFWLQSRSDICVSLQLQVNRDHLTKLKLWIAKASDSGSTRTAFRWNQSAGAVSVQIDVNWRLQLRLQASREGQTLAKFFHIIIGLHILIYIYIYLYSAVCAHWYVYPHWYIYCVSPLIYIYL